jgi:transcriptional regulator
MYNVPYFKASEQKDVTEFMRQHSFVILCGVDSSGKPVATHVPVLMEEREDKLFLLAHVMKKQAHTEAFLQNNKVLAIFYGPHTYVSASWYENKQVASTWNYQAVHAQGTLRFLNKDGLLKIITSLTEHFENNPHSPSLVQKMDPAYIEKSMQAIIAFEIEVQSIEHVFKLSQNREAESYHNIVKHLKEGDHESKAIADEMKQLQPKLFDQH